METEAELAAAEIPIEPEMKTKKRGEPKGAERRTSRAATQFGGETLQLREAAE